jgi:glucosamine--fructose-6-phosphate aminotransferase (isomerizing)
MCGIVGAIAERNIVPVLVEGLKRLEYRGYDSAGIAVVQGNQKLGLCRTVGKVSQLESKLATEPLAGRLGVAHTRWATHGGVTEANAHPHLSGGRVAVIHNGIIENYQPLKDELIAKGDLPPLIGVTMAAEIMLSVARMAPLAEPATA